MGIPRYCVLTLCLFLNGVLADSSKHARSASPDESASEVEEINVEPGISPNGQENAPESKSENRYSRTVKGDFQDVFSELEFAITEKNYRITSVNSIGRAISDRGDSPFPLASVVHFCNIEAAKQILEISMDYLLLMPCRVTIQEIEEGYVLVEASMLPLDDEKLLETALSVNALLREIVDFAAGDW